MNEIIIRTTNLWKYYRNRLGASGIFLNITKGDIYGLIGPEGSGKSSILRALAGSLPSRGQIYIQNRSLRDSPCEALAGVEAVLDPPLFYKCLTGRQNLSMTATNQRNCPGQVEEVIGHTRLGDWAEQNVNTYPEVVLRRLAIARALISKPKILLLDEPHRGLNSGNKADLLGTIKCLGGILDLTLVVSFADPQDAKEICSRVALMDKGIVFAEGAARLLLAEEEDLRLAPRAVAGRM